MSIGISLMIEGVKDMCDAVYSAWKGLDIDWGAWGKEKVISFGITLAMAGPAALSELGSLAKQGFKSITASGGPGFINMLKKIPSITKIGL